MDRHPYFSECLRSRKKISIDSTSEEWVSALPRNNTETVIMYTLHGEHDASTLLTRKQDTLSHEYDLLP